MLNIKYIYIYASSLMFFSHLGCMSSYRYQMDEQEKALVSTQPGHDVTDVLNLAGNIEGSILEALVEKFLNTGYFESGCSTLGSSSVATEDENKNIDLVLNKLNKSINRSSIDAEYLKFLKSYRFISGAGFEICGPIENTEYIVSMQHSFEDLCRRKSKKTTIKSCWLVAKIDQGDKYYIDLSRDTKGYIYSMSPDGKSMIFAKSFLDFLDKFFEYYNNKKEEDLYEDNISEENVYQKINKLLELSNSKQGCPIDNDEIRFVLEGLGRNENMFDLDLLEEYKEFLNQFGAIYGEGFEICGPTKDMNDTEERVKYMVSMQRSFEEKFKELKRKETTPWLIAKNGDKQYFINLSGGTSLGSVYIYDIGDHGNPYTKRFAESFSEFLDKFFEDYKKNTPSSVAGSSK